jgi:hypothetical protein
MLVNFTFFMAKGSFWKEICILLPLIKNTETQNRSYFCQNWIVSYWPQASRYGLVSVATDVCIPEKISLLFLGRWLPFWFRLHPIFVFFKQLFAKWNFCLERV